MSAIVSFLRRIHLWRLLIVGLHDEDRSHRSVGFARGQWAVGDPYDDRATAPVDGRQGDLLGMTVRQHLPEQRSATGPLAGRCRGSADVGRLPRFAGRPRGFSAGPFQTVTCRSRLTTATPARRLASTASRKMLASSSFFVLSCSRSLMFCSSSLVDWSSSFMVSSSSLVDWSSSLVVSSSSTVD